MITRVSTVRIVHEESAWSWSRAILLPLSVDLEERALTCPIADDCIVDRCQKNKIYIVATNDRDLKRRIRKIPGVSLEFPRVGCFRSSYHQEMSSCIKLLLTRASTPQTFQYQ